MANAIFVVAGCEGRAERLHRVGECEWCHMHRVHAPPQPQIAGCLLNFRFICPDVVCCSASRSLVRKHIVANSHQSMICNCINYRTLAWKQWCWSMHTRILTPWLVLSLLIILKTMACTHMGDLCSSDINQQFPFSLSCSKLFFHFQTISLPMCVGYNLLVTDTDAVPVGTILSNTTPATLWLHVSITRPIHLNRAIVR